MLREMPPRQPRDGTQAGFTTTVATSSVQDTDDAAPVVQLPPHIYVPTVTNWPTLTSMPPAEQDLPSYDGKNHARHEQRAHVPTHALR